VRRRRTLSEVLADARQERRLTQPELAQRIRVSSQQISRWERGIQRPNRDNIKLLADELGLDVNDLLGLALEAQAEELTEMRRDLADVRRDRDLLLEKFEELARRIEAATERLETESKERARRP